MSDHTNPELEARLDEAWAALDAGSADEALAAVRALTSEPGAAAYGGPVLVVHGDGHVYTRDNPFHGPLGQTLENVLRVEVPGALDIRAVRIRIDPRAPVIFDVEVFSG